MNKVQNRLRLGRMTMRAMLLCASLSVASIAHAYVTYSGTVNMLEVWKTGNVAFTLTPAVTAFCGGQFIVNVSAPGARNLIATLLAAKAAGKIVRVTSYVDGNGCIGADGYGGAYIDPTYVYLMD